jgi:hypothetical protein
MGIGREGHQYRAFSGLTIGAIDVPATIPIGPSSAMRVLLLVLALFFVAPQAEAEEWTSRSGSCFEWEGLWAVQRDQSGVWNGSIDMRQVGGPCVAPADSFMTAEVRAAIVGDEFFARIVLGASGSCLANGRVQGTDVRGFMLCHGVAQQLAFALRMRPN